MTIDWNKRTEQYVKLRDLKKEIKDRHTQELAPINDMMEKLEALFLRELNASKQDSAKAASGTVYKTIKRTASLEDPAQFRSYVIGGELWDLADMRANVAAVEDFVKEHGQLPPGVKYSEIEEVGIRRGTKKEAA
jgi:hypothetical protein